MDLTLYKSIINICRDESERKYHQKGHLMWLVEKYVVEEYRKVVIKEVEFYRRG